MKLQQLISILLVIGFSFKVSAQTQNILITSKIN